MKIFGFYPKSIGYIIKGSKIDILALLQTFNAYRKGVFLTIGFFASFFLLVAFILPNTYKSSTVILTQSDESSSLNKLGNLASLAGVDLSAMIESPSIVKPEVFPQILSSYTFLNQLINTNFREMGSDNSESLYKIILSSNNKGVGKKIQKYTINLPQTVLTSLFKKPSIHYLLDSSSLIVMSEEEEGVYQKVMNSLDISVDRTTNLVQLSVVLNDPYLSAQVAQKSLELLQNMVIGFKTKQVKDNLDYITERFEEQKEQYDSIRHKVLNYKDAHRNMVIERSSGELQDLEMKYNLISSVYQMLAQQMEQARLTLRKETPIFSVIEPVKVPIYKNGPKYSMYLLFGVLFGLITSILIVTIKIIIFNISRSFISEKI